MKYFNWYFTLITVLFFNDVLCTEENDIVVTVELDRAPRKHEKLIESNSSTPEKVDIVQELASIDSLMKDLVFSGVDNVMFMTEKSDFAGSTSQKLPNLIGGLNNKIMQVTKFADYFEVLSYIDRSIFLIYELINYLKNNQFDNEIFKKDSILRVDQGFEEIKTLLPKIEKLLKDKEGKPNSSNFDYIREELISRKKQVVLLKDQFKIIKTFRFEDYFFANTMKIDKLTSLQEYLINLRGEIYPMNEENIEKNVSYFKNEFIKGVSGVYEKLIDSRERSQKLLSFIFQGFLSVQTEVMRCVDDLMKYQSALERR